MPACDNKELIGVFHDMGLAMVIDTVKPFTFSEIAGFKSATGLNLSHGEVVSIKRMSECFTTWLSKGKEHACSAPFYKDNRSVEDMRADVSSKFKALARKNKK